MDAAAFTSGITASTLASDSFTPMAFASTTTVSFIFPDFRSVTNLRRLLPRDFCTTDTLQISGYEAYLVEQWVCERRPNTVIVTYTGNSAHKLKGQRVTVPRDDRLWPPAFIEYHRTMSANHSQPKATKYGQLFVTNILTVPSYLTLLAVPNGDVRTVVKQLELNVNLRKVNCSGRAGLLLSQPTQAAEHKFRQTFRINAKVPIEYAAREVVLLVQFTLYFFGMLEPFYGDGFFCNETEAAIARWWERVGTLRYHERATLFLDARCVAALLGALLGVRSRLHLVGIDVPKDPYYYFDSFESAISSFQRQHKLPRTHKLDAVTLEALYRISDGRSRPNQASHTFTKAVKTVQDIGRLRREALPSSFESLDIETVQRAISGRRLGVLWLDRGADPEVFPTLAELARQKKREKSEPNPLHKSVDRLRLGLATRRHHPRDLSTPSFVEATQYYKPEAESCHSYAAQAAGGGSRCGLEPYYSGAMHRRMSFPYLPLEMNYATTLAVMGGAASRASALEPNTLRGEENVETLALHVEGFLARLTDQNLLPAEESRVVVSPSPKEALGVVEWARVSEEPFSRAAESGKVCDDPSWGAPLRRSHSFGEAADSILRFSYPFVVSEFVMSRGYLQALRDCHRFNMRYNAFVASQCYATYQVVVDGWKAQRHEEEARAAHLQRQKALKAQQMGKLEMRMKAMDSLLAKLNYELRMLGKRLVELEDNASQFSDKLDVAAEGVARLQGCFKHATADGSAMDVSVAYHCATRYLSCAMAALQERVDWARIGGLWQQVDKNNHIRDMVAPYLGYPVKVKASE